jgi:hypothetical protein
MSSKDEEDSIALTSQAAKKHSAYSLGDEEPWSPTVHLGKAQVQRVISVQGGNKAPSIV